MNQRCFLLGLAITIAFFLFLPEPVLAAWTEEPDYHHSAICCYGDELVFDWELASWYDTYIPDDAIQSFLFGQCYSGGLINDLATGPNRVIATSSDWGLPAHYSLEPLRRGTTYVRFWDDAVDRDITGNETYLQAYSYATANNPSSLQDKPQYYSENSTLDSLDLGSAFGDKYALLFVGLSQQESERLLMLAELNAMRSTLLHDYDYDPNNIKIFFCDGYGDSYISGAGTKANFETAISDFGNVMDVDDSLFLWVLDHGTDRNATSTTVTTPGGGTKVIPVRPPEVQGKKVINFQIPIAFFGQGGSLTESVSMEAYTKACDGSSELITQDTDILVWHQGDINLTVNNTDVVTSHSECAVCTADAMAHQTTTYVANDNGWQVTEFAEVFASVIVEGEVPTPDDCVAFADVCKDITVTDWVAGGVFWLNLQINVPGKLVGPGNLGGQAKLQWNGALNAAGWGDLWQLTIEIEEDDLVVDFWSNENLGLDDEAVEATVAAAFIQDENLWWQVDIIDLGNLQMVIEQSEWNLTTCLIASAEAPCVPEPSTLMMLALGTFCALLIRRRT